MEITHRRNSTTGMISHLESSWGARWDEFSQETKRQEFESLRHLLKSIGFECSAENPFEKPL